RRFRLLALTLLFASRYWLLTQASTPCGKTIFAHTDGSSGFACVNVTSSITVTGWTFFALATTSSTRRARPRTIRGGTPTETTALVEVEDWSAITLTEIIAAKIVQSFIFITQPSRDLISGSVNVRHLPGFNSPSLIFPTCTRCRRFTVLPIDSNSRRTSRFFP